jgi:hypothetical protein
MSSRVSRRSLLKAAGAGGVGLSASMLAGRALAAYRSGTVPTPDLRDLPRVPEGVPATDRAALGRDEVLKTPSGPALAYRPVALQFAPGDDLSHLGVDLQQVALEFVCDPRRPNILLEGVTRVTYEVQDLAWQADEGWPVYRSRSPHADPQIGQRYAGVPRHQVVFLDDRAVYVGNRGTSGVIDHIEGPLRVDVNGEGHDRHRGFFKILITGSA